MEKIYYNWLENIRDWCISRQLWWGHRIPAWYGPDKYIFVARDENEAKEMALKHYGKEVELVQEEMFLILGSHLLFGLSLLWDGLKKLKLSLIHI